MRRALVASIAALALLVATGCSSKDDDGPAPNPGPPALDPGGARLTPATGSVPSGSTFVVYLDVNSGDSALGAFSGTVTFDSAAFQFVSVAGTDAVLGAPRHQSETSPGTLYLAWLNASPPDETLKGMRRVAEITFLATGAAGAGMNLAGSVLTLGDTAFTSQDIGAGAFPRAMQVMGTAAVGN